MNTFLEIAWKWIMVPAVFIIPPLSFIVWVRWMNRRFFVETEKIRKRSEKKRAALRNLNGETIIGDNQYILFDGAENIPDEFFAEGKNAYTGRRKYIE